jgi:3-(methylsulfanyl)propanoyl-CoA dehydrogenase
MAGYVPPLRDIRFVLEQLADLDGLSKLEAFGEHDLAGNIIHLVLARVPDAPPGTRGISCFIVPKYLVNADGSLGARNDLRCVSIEHKLGIHASPTCVM